MAYLIFGKSVIQVMTIAKIKELNGTNSKVCLAFIPLKRDADMCKETLESF